MSEPTGLTAVALVVSFTALIIAVSQLLQSVFGTAEGFRRTHKEIMGIFAISRDRVFHWAELRFETKFTTPHFSFHHVLDEGSLLSKVEEKDHLGQITSSKYVLAVADGVNRLEDLTTLITSSTKISVLQRFLNRMDHDHNPSASQTLLPASQAFSATWLTLLEQLYHDEKKYNQRTDKISYLYSRHSHKGEIIGPDPRQILYPSIECHLRSWDLMPPDAVRPFASITLGDLLTLCYRLRITVDDLRPGRFSANGFGNNLASLQIQGLGMVVQYQYDSSHDPEYHALKRANTKFIPSENADKMAFAIIPRNERLGIYEDWHLGEWNGWEKFPDNMREHFKALGIPDRHLSQVKVLKDKQRCDTWRVFADSILLLAPFMPIEGLGVVKYQPPIPHEYLNSTLGVREGPIVLRERLNELYPTFKDHVHNSLPAPASSIFAQMQWICSIFNFLESKYHTQFYHGGRGFYKPLLDSNACMPQGHDLIREIHSAFSTADEYLALLFNSPQHAPTYTYLVAAHQEVAMRILVDIQTEINAHGPNKAERSESNRTAPKFRAAPTFPTGGMHRGLMEAIHRFIDAADKEIIDSYRAKTDGLLDTMGRRPAELSDELVRTGWWTMMLRACLWGIVHLPIARPGLPYPSRYWKNGTLVLIV
jgi:hypothetical protein